MTELGRLSTAMVPPMRSDGSLDVDRARLAADLLAIGSDGVVLARAARLRRPRQ